MTSKIKYFYPVVCLPSPCDLSRRCELEDASLLGYGGALLLGNETRHQLRPEATCLLRVQVALLLRLLDEADLSLTVTSRYPAITNDRLLVVALLGPLLEGTAGAAQRDRPLRAPGKWRSKKVNVSPSC